VGDAFNEFARGRPNQKTVCEKHNDVLQFHIHRIQEPGMRGAAEGGSSRQSAQPETGVEGRRDFFIWIRRNPLKSPDSAKGIQGSASLFAWFY
jgi:hypothetical protein